MMAGGAGAAGQKKHFREAVLFNIVDTWKLFHVLPIYHGKFSTYCDIKV